MFSKVVITADILRPFPAGAFYESATRKNIRWLHALLKQPLQNANIDVSMLAWDSNLPGGHDFFDTPALYQALGTPLNFAGWAKLAASDSPPEALLAMLRQPLNNALVIGYELPDVMINALRILGTPFIDLVLHPFRFLPDLVFSFRTNISEYHQAFERYRLQQEHIEQQVSLLLAKNAWMRKPDDITVPPGSAIILEQVAIDMAIVTKEGRFSSLEDHLPYLHQIVSDHPAVFFKPHPYSVSRNSLSRLKEIFPVITVCDTNLYHLMMQQETEKVIALNSSGLIEAKAFGKVSENLIPFRYNHTENFLPESGKPGSLIPLNNGWLSSRFWINLFEGKNLSQPLSTADIWQPDRLRSAMNADWGFHFINRTVV